MVISHSYAETRDRALLPARIKEDFAKPKLHEAPFFPALSR